MRDKSYGKLINLKNDFVKLCEKNNIPTGYIKMNKIDEILLISVEYYDTYVACTNQKFVDWLCKKLSEYELDIEKIEIQIIPKELFKEYKEDLLCGYGKFHIK